MNELLATPSYKGSIECIESGHNEDYTQWYRIYSDGWCEQGGSIKNSTSNTISTVTFLKEFINTQYTLISSNIPDSIGIEENWSSKYTLAKINKTTKGFTAYRAGKATSYDWEAKGYIKE